MLDIGTEHDTYAHEQGQQKQQIRFFTSSHCYISYLSIISDLP
jgi:hypothetical protein